MKTAIFRNSIFPACGFLFALTLSASAALTEMNISYDTSYTGSITGGGAINANVYLTAFLATPIGGEPLPPSVSNPFYTFCLDIAPELISTAWWNSGTFANAGAGNTVGYKEGGIQRAASLYKAYVGNVSFGSPVGKQQGAALQLAIWNVLYDDDGTVLSGGGFRVAGADSFVTSLADSMLASSYNVANPNLNSTFWNATDASGIPVFNQDLIGPEMTSAIPSIPETNTWVAFAGFICLANGLTRFRRLV